VARSRPAVLLVGDIYASTSWYRERPEPEELLEGLLIEAPPATGSGEQRALGFVLVTFGAKYPVYAAGREEKLTRLAGWRLRVRAKRVDLREEGFGEELWIGTVDEASL
jgi:hypothetical protein